MARPLRIEYPGAVYHVTSRGNARQNIFLDSKDREIFLNTLAGVVEEFNWLCHAYCLMDNHYHLLLETPDANLSRGMRQLNGVYTQIFNRRHDTFGHLFQGRYKAILVEKESYLLALSRYIVLNPVRAGKVKNVQDWPWSSYLATAGIVPPPSFLFTDWILSQFAAERNRARAIYTQFVKSWSGDSPWDSLRGQIYLGSEMFIKNLAEREPPDQEKAPAKGSALTEVPRFQRNLHRPELEEIFSGRAEEEAIALAYRQHGYTMREIAQYLGVHYSTVSRRLKGSSP